ncbi:hypothetical protein BDZ91DRAFT_458984 [Kalaharituber pfeilii]|nr:hypothetical protein BDZ91DRAFT_458984 [Kalaharituber pfeilii]
MKSNSPSIPPLLPLWTQNPLLSLVPPTQYRSSLIKREELPRCGLADNEFDLTDEELSTLRRVADHFPVAAYFIVIVELCERFGYYGINAPLQNYISYPKEGNVDGELGAIGLGQQGATASTNFFHFWAYLAPIRVAIIADGYLGR